ncbi:DnaJ domain-containing protein [Tepidicaulis sp.]|uniref:DnaJ domain-containing protein n=1 Tax=Tepidicaulis sp. TaxID=1920809 RepID=UPI003B5BDD4E
MIWFVLGGVLLAGLLWFLYRLAYADSARVVSRARTLGAAAAIIVGLGLALTGRIGLAVVLFGAAAGLLGFGGFGPFGQLGGNASGGAAGGMGGRPPQPGQMSRAEALEVLGLREGASADEIKQAHRKLLGKVHPDREGTTYLASKINEAKDVLLKK